MVDDENNWVVMGKFGRPFGIKGQIYVHSFATHIDDLLNYHPWYQKSKDGFNAIALVEPNVRNDHILVSVEGFESREKVSALTNQLIYILKNQLPELRTDEYYWHELIGMRVLSSDDAFKGYVVEVMATGSNDVLVVTHDDKRYLVPFLLDSVIESIDKETRCIKVDWDWE